MQLKILNSVESTNEYLHKWSIKEFVEEGFMVHSHTQTRGKGQHGNEWESQSGKNITASIILYPRHINLAEQFSLSIAVALGVYDFINTFIPNEVSIKWPNDIYVQDRKIAGILIDQDVVAKCIDKCIVGIGININQTNFSKDIPNATSLILETGGQEYSIESLLEILQTKVISRYHSIAQLQHDEYMSLLYRTEGYHLFEAFGEVFEAKIINVNLKGFLVLETKDAVIKEFSIKEVSYK